MTGVRVGPSRIAGRGLFAGHAFAAGERILEIDVRDRLGPQRPLRPGESESHVDRIWGGRLIHMKPPERYINHSCDPNASCRRDGERLWLVARRPIAPGEEIVTHYAVNSAEDHAWACACGAANCLGTATCDFFRLPAALQREYLPLLDGWFIDEQRARLRAAGLLD